MENFLKAFISGGLFLFGKSVKYNGPIIKELRGKDEFLGSRNATYPFLKKLPKNF